MAGRALFALLLLVLLRPASPASTDAGPDKLSSLRYQLAAAGTASEILSVPSRESLDWRPAIAIIIDDLGYSYERGRNTLRLPGPVTVAVIPELEQSRRLARKAQTLGNEVMLHLPMQAYENDKPAGDLRVDMAEDEIRRRTRRFLDAVPHIRGVNNHRGGYFTQHVGPMTWAMQEIAGRGGLYYVDSRTNPGTMGQQLAIEHHLPSARRDVFLDSTPRDAGFVDSQFDKLLKLARARGAAIGIGHPHDETLSVLNRRLAQLHREGVQLLPVSKLLDLKVRRQVWRTSLSRSRTGAKNSKPSLSSTY